MKAIITKIIPFNDAGGTLKVKVAFDTLLACTYKIMLREKGSNATFMSQTGDNTNDQDDIYPLPLPVGINNNRSLWAVMTIIDQTGKGGKYNLSMEIIQDDKIIGSIETSEKSIAGNNTTEILIVKLTC